MSESNAAPPPGALTRRAVVAGGCGLACAAALTACAGYGAGQPAPPPAAAPAAGGGGAALARTADIPVGGGKVFADRNLVVTQPVAGTFKAFSATCTHQGCLVNEVAGGTINCPCHGSKFAVADGAVTAGPAGSPLPAKEITVQGDAITAA
jgi:nitrite reductase/ring-hydroxylating ferredoxin subunit